MVSELLGSDSHTLIGDVHPMQDSQTMNTTVLLGVTIGYKLTSLKVVGSSRYLLIV